MAGVLPMDTVMRKLRQAHGYSILVATDENPWFAPGVSLQGHEFHHSEVVNVDPALHFVFKNQRGHGVADSLDGICYKSVIATYTHVNAVASPVWAECLTAQARLYQLKN